MKLPWVALAVALVTTPSFAEEKTALVVIREAGAETCPDAVQIAAKVNTIVNREVIGSGPGEDSAWIEVTLQKGAEGYRATVRTYGASVGQRELSDASPECAPLAEAVAVSLALMWTSQETGGAEPEASSDPVPDPPEESPPPAARTAHAPASSSRARRPTPRRAPAEQQLHVGLDGLLGVALAVLEHPVPSAEFGVRADVMKRASFSIVGGAAGPDQIQVDGGNVDLLLLQAGVRACVGVVSDLRVLFCLRPALGRLSGEGTDFDRSWQRQYLQPNLGIGVEARGPITRALGWAAELVASVPLARHSFSVVDAEGEHTVFTTPNVGLWALVGVSWEVY